jgi:autotransporter-associated beta strand protein
MKAKLFAFPISILLASSAIAGQFVWTGATDSAWTNPTNWNTSTSPPSTAGAELTFPAYGTNYTADNVRIANATGAGAIYDPGAALTTTFRTGRGIIIGATSAGNLTISSGTLAAVFTAANSNGENDPLMGNNVNATLLINGGTLDVTGVQQGDGTLRPFQLVWAGGPSAPGITSEATITSGTLACNNLNLQQGGSFGTGIINLEGTGVLSLRAFVRNSPNGSSIINLNGGTLRARFATTDFLPALTNTQVRVNENGGTINSNGFNITIAANMSTHPGLNGAADGGLIKTGAGNLTLNGSSTFNGGVSVNQGRVILAATDSSAGTGTVTLANTGAELQIGGGRNLANPIVVADTGDLKTLFFVNTPGSTLSGPITINESTQGNFRIQVNSDNFLTIDGKITGTGGAGIQKVNPGWLNLRNADNDFTGGIQITSGILNFDNGGLGTGGNITMDGGSLRWRPGFANEDVSSRLVMVDGKAATLITGDETTSVTFSQPIGNNSTASLVKQGGGTLTLTGTNTYTGTTTISGGTLRVNGSLHAASAVTVTEGNLGGAGTVDGNVTVQAAGHITPGISAGTLTIGGELDVVAMANGAGTLKFELAANTASSDQLAVTGTLNIGTGALGLNDFDFTNLGGLQAGTYTLITSGSINGSLDATDQSGEIATGFNGSLQSNGNNLELVVTAATTGAPYDTWASQITNGLSLRTDDADGDGFSNLQEFLFGTSPISGNGALVNTTSSAGNLTLRWLQRESGATYTLKQSASLAEGSWTPVISPLPALDENQSGAPTDYNYHSVTLPTSDGKLFFRVEGVEN